METAASSRLQQSSINLFIPEYGIGIRHLQALLLFLAMVLSLAMRVNMSLAIVAMTDGYHEDTFKWSLKTQSLIMSSFFWGYVVLQIPGGELAARFGGKPLIILSVGIDSTMTLFLPLGAYLGGWKLLCALRVVQGLAQGLLYPAMHHVIGKWAPTQEKSRFGTFVYAGAQLGMALQFMLSGFVVDVMGWPAIFYVNGTLGAFWTAFYIIYGASSPRSSKMISLSERFFIESSHGEMKHKKRKTPCKAIWTSLPFISLIIVHIAQNWGFWTLMTQIPTYMKQVLDVDIKTNGVLSSVPYWAIYVMSFPFGYMADLALNNEWLSITSVRKLSNSVGHYGPAIMLIVLSYAPVHHYVLDVTLLTVLVGLNAGHFTGFLLVHIDMSPNFAGVLMGITNFFSNFVSILAPIAVGCIIHDETSVSDWRKVFFLSSAIYVIGNTIFVIFGSCEVQPWNFVPSAEESIDIGSIRPSGLFETPKRPEIINL